MRAIRQGEVVTLRAEVLEPGEPNLPHVALEDSFAGRVRVEAVGNVGLRFKPINVWRVEWVA